MTPRPKPVDWLPKVSELYLLYNESRTGGDPEEPENRWTSHTDEVIEFYPTGLFTNKGSFQETIDIPFDPIPHIGKPVYIVVVRYYDGSTFGRIRGRWKIAGAFTDQETVKKVVEVVRHSKYSSEVDAGLLPYICSGFYATWFGHFQGFEGVEIHEFLLSGDNPLANFGKDSYVTWVRH